MRFEVVITHLVTIDKGRFDAFHNLQSAMAPLASGFLSWRNTAGRDLTVNDCVVLILCRLVHWRGEVLWRDDVGSYLTCGESATSVRVGKRFVKLW
jgi:hypothetical protein